MIGAVVKLRLRSFLLVSLVLLAPVSYSTRDLNAFGEKLAIETVPDPVLGTEEVIVDAAAASIASYTGGVLFGARNYLLEPPVVPGPGGTVRVCATGPDATKLSVGDWVFCDPTIRSRDDVVRPDMMLLGWTPVGVAALPLQRYLHNGTFAEQVLLPTENVRPIGEIEAADAGRWCALSSLLVPCGGLLAGDLRPGETLVVNGLLAASEAPALLWRSPWAQEEWSPPAATKGRWRTYSTALVRARGLPG